MLRDLSTQKFAPKKVTDFGYPRACRFRNHQIENRLPAKKLPKIDQKWNFSIFLTVFVLTYKTVSLHDLKNVKIAEKSLKIGQFLNLNARPTVSNPIM
jgi:hypothetical protein